MRALVLLFVLACSLEPSAEPLAPDAVPEPLKPWIGWVLHEHTDLACPVRHGQDSRDCTWPGELSIDATSTGAIFEQAVTVYRKGRLRLPGDLQAWPRAVRAVQTATPGADQAEVPVIDQGGVPVVELPAGEYRIRGVIEWQVMPTALAVPPQTGIVRYRRDGAEVRLPQLRDGRLWLRDDVAGMAKAPEDSLRMEVYRLVEDGHPATVVTHLAIEVSGRQRELVLGRPLLEGLLPLRLESGLPARLEPDGGLRVQVRPGRWAIRVYARHPAAFTRLRLAAQPEPWPANEVWVLRTSPRDRLIEVGGLPQIDPRQVDLPPDWVQLPAYRMTAPQDFVLDVIRRGDPQPEPDSLALERDLWLDFDGDGYTVRDRISGRMTQGWRLSVDEAFDLGRVTIDGQAQFITRLADETRDGVEVRRGQLDLVAESRYAGAIDDLPAVGWGQDFQEVSANLHLPPGWRLFAVSGVDNVPASWIQRWTLYDVFLVLIVTVAVGRLWGWRWSPVALLTLLLAWHEPDAPRMTWLYLLAAIALLRVVPAGGRFHGVLKFARLAGLAVLLLIILPFMVALAREGLYPQLERHLAVPAAPTVLTAGFDAYDAEPASSPRQIAEGAADAVSSRLAPDRLLEKTTLPPGGRLRALDEIDPSATIQTGPGLPDWRWTSARLSWNGPVAADQRIGIYLLGPTSHLVLNFLTMGLVLLLAWRFLDLGARNGGWRKGLLLLLVIGASSGGASASLFPPPDMLEALERRLTAVPTEAPRATIEDMVVSLGPDHYLASLTVHALQRTSIPLPVDTALTTPVRVSVQGGEGQPPLYRSEENQLWLLAPAGVSRIELEVLLPAVNQLQIPLPLRPRRVTVHGEGWTVEGIDRNGVPQQQLSLVRIRATGAAATDELAPSVLPPFLRVERTVHFGIQWEIRTRVLRESPLGTSLSVQIPIVPGASVTSDGLPVKDGRVMVTMAANQREVGWRSRLDPVESLTLAAAQTDQWLETWFADIGTVWHVTTEGIPPVHHQDAGRNWLPGWHPWPGEQLTFRVQRPAGVAGRTLTIDQSQLLVEPGKRATDTTLSFRLRASQGGRHELTLPQDASLQSVRIDGRTQPIRQQDRQVSLPVMPGVQHYELSWRQMSGIQAHWQTPAVALGGESVNASITVLAPRDRWILWLSGPRLGPAVLFWGVLAVIVVAALILARVSASYLPVGLASWLLLGIGLTQVSVLGMLVLVGWFFLVHYRSTLSADTPRGLFNAVQLLIVALSVIAFSILTWAVQTGLLGLPAMQIEGNGSSAYELNWYQDRIGEPYPQATIISVPLFVYRILMMAWALWLAYSLLKWIAWAWSAASRGGLWRSVTFSLGRFKSTQGTRPTGNDATGGGTVGSQVVPATDKGRTET